MAIAALPVQTCRFRCLGPVSLIDAAGEAVPFRTRKQIALLLFLARRPGRPIARDEVIDLLWSGDAEKAARHSLSQSVSLINKALGGESIATAGRDRLVLQAGAASLDVNEFERLASTGEYAAAMDLWRGTLLEGIWVQRAPNFERWLSDERARLQGIFRRLAHTRLEAFRVAGDYPSMRDESERLLQYDQLDERAMLAHLEALTLLEDRSLALRRFVDFEARLKQDLSAEPGVALRNWVRRNRRGDETRQPASMSVLRISELTVLPAAVPLYGRQEEYAVLWKAWEATRNGGGRLIVIQGEPGIGKTALVTKLVNQAHVGGGSVCYVTCYRTEKSVPFAPITALVRQLSRLPGFVALDPVWIGELSRLAPELRERYQNAPLPMVVDDAARHRLSDAAVRAALSVADEQPLLLAFDDLQDADEPTLALLHYLCRQPQQPALIIGLRRIGQEPADYERTFFNSLTSGGLCQEMTLRGLASEDVERLVNQVAATRGVAIGAERVRQVAQQSRGNPLHAIEATLADDKRSEIPEATSSNSGEAVPEGTFVQTALRRLTALSAPSRTVAQILAVAGHPLSEYELAEVTHLKPAELGSALGALESAHFVRRSGSRVRLSHERYAAAAECSLSRGERAGIHTGLARLIAGAAASNPSARYQAARHFEAAGNLIRAAECGAEAARFAAQIGAVRSEADALRLVRRVASPARHETDVALALCLLETNQFEELDSLCAELRSTDLPDVFADELTFIDAAAAAESGRASMHDIRHRLEHLLMKGTPFPHRRTAAVLLVRVADKVGDYGLAQRTARQLRHGDPQNQPDRHAVFAAGYCISKYRDPRRAIPLLERAIRMSQESNDWPLESLSRDGLGIALKQIGKFRDSIEQFNISLALAKRIMNPNAEARCLQNRVVSEMALGQTSQALATFDEADLLPHESWAFRTFNSYNRAIVAFFAGNYGDAMSRFAGTADVARRHGMEYVVADSLAGASLSALRLGDRNVFASRAEAAIRIEDPMDRTRQSWIIQSVAAWYRAIVRNDLTGAVEILDSCLKRTRRFDIAHWMSLSLERILLIEMVSGRRADQERDALGLVAESLEAAQIAALCQSAT